MTIESKRALALLAACQALLLTNNIVNITMNGVAGLDLATDSRWATLPLSAYTLATALCVFPAALWMRRRGRRSGFVLGCALGMLGALVCALAAWTRSFALLTVGNVIAGGYNAFGQYYRFAAADLVAAERKSTAVSLVVAGGLAGAFLGPEASKLTRTALSQPYLGTYLFLAACAALATLLAARAGRSSPEQPVPAAAKPAAGPAPRGRALLAAVLACACGQAVMNYLMTSTPLAMAAHHHAYDEAAFVIEWHAVAMFAPSLILGPVIARTGTRFVIGLGVVLGMASVGAAQLGDDVATFWVALVLLGLAWSLMYVGGTTALAQSYAPGQRFTVQGINDTVVFVGSSAASAASGWLLASVGWPAMAWPALAPLALAGAASLVWAPRPHHPPTSVARPSA